MAFSKVIEVRMKGQIHGQQCINVFHFGTNEAAVNNDAIVAMLVRISVAIIQCAVAQLRGGVTSDYRLEGCDAKQLHPFVSDVVESNADPDTIGLRGPVNTSFEAVLFRVKTGGGGRRGRGRHFLPPAGDADITNSLLSGSESNNFYIGFLQCLSDKFIGAAATDAARLGVLSQKTLKEQPGNFDVAFREAVALDLETRISCMRSRKLGHGN